MKRLPIIFLLLPVLFFAACNPNTPAETLSLNPNVLQLTVGDVAQIETEGTARNLEWSCSDDSVVSVYYGVVTALRLGQATITVKNDNVSANCEVYVSGTDGATLRISPLVVSLSKGETMQMRCGNTYGTPITWSSDNESIATVDADGLVTAVAPGNAHITVSNGLEEATALIAVKHNYGEYQLVWSDEFNGTALDTEVWGFNTGGGGWGNNEKQYYTDRTENVRVEDGYLKIEARKEDYSNNHYTSGRILSKGKKTFTYGKFEARIKFPGGKGTWPAFWMMGNAGGWPACGEIDIQEHVGSIPTRASFALHTPDKNGTKGNNWSKTAWFDYDLSEDFHVYGMEWAKEVENGKDVIRFFVDGVQYAESWESKIDDPNAWPFTKPHFIIFNVAIGGNMGGSIDDAIFDTERIMYVDWVRVYQREDID